MAISVAVTTNAGFEAPAAYIKVDHFQGNKDKVHASVSIYYNSTARTEDKDPISHRSVSISTPTTNIMSAIYDHLKSLPEYAGATDV